METLRCGGFFGGLIYLLFALLLPGRGDISLHVFNLLVSITIGAISTIIVSVICKGVGQPGSHE